ncbi:hypothetical protein [Acinetobacter haemolyticus]|uniref:hypothetical protein n=1 Tax=Acinetobacter haemolyticus TaxID=29430 RepID=UPI001331EDFC|nr:hypothetical protein [Acinetobacter haemolyticus]NAS03707.1 hypothetical protein [Acinetobacter haemolyticus]NAS08452.1 hypothetical protein [Acinetobacter haemolyticus]QHI29951.1 hypothetical protein AhaeINNSZ174_10945 [Acinetobacter haemolyticus]QHI32305.1 hypothetical protein Ahae11616_06415 [Acinetobacter haemolyticus]
MNKTILRLLILLGSVMLLVLAWQHFDSKPEFQTQTQSQHQDVAIGFAPIPASPPSCTTTDVDQTSAMTDSTSTDDAECIGMSLPADFEEVEIEERGAAYEQTASTPVSAEAEQSGLKRMLQTMFYKILQLLSKL